MSEPLVTVDGQFREEQRREMAIECGAATEDEIAAMTEWEVVVGGVRYRGDASKP